MDERVREGILAVRATGRTNMSDIPVVQRIAMDLGYYDTVIWIEENRKAYFRFISAGCAVHTRGALILMEPELLSQCLTDWMTEKDVSVADLAGMVGYKSKTSVFRLLKDQCNEQTMASFVELLTPYLDEEWVGRFQKSLRVEKYGLQRYQMFESMMDCIRNPQRPATVCQPSLIPSGGENIMILGYPWKDSSSLIDRMLQDGYHIVHYVEKRAIYTFPGLLQKLILHIDRPGYEAMMVEERPSGVWNVMATDAGQLFVNGQW